MQFEQQSMLGIESSGALLAVADRQRLAFQLKDAERDRFVLNVNFSRRFTRIEPERDWCGLLDLVLDGHCVAFKGKAIADR